MIRAPRAAAAWWRELQPDPAGGRQGDRAALARLRRCATVSEAMQEVAAIQLFRRVGATGPGDLPDVALAAAVLAHVRADAPGTVARTIGPTTPEKPETAKMKPLRFRRLMEADGPDERLVAFRRLVMLARENALPVADLATSLLGWSEQRRRQWIFDYWDAEPTAPSPTPPSAASPAATRTKDHAG